MQRFARGARLVIVSATLGEERPSYYAAQIASEIPIALDGRAVRRRCVFGAAFGANGMGAGRPPRLTAVQRRQYAAWREFRRTRPGRHSAGD